MDVARQLPARQNARVKHAASLVPTPAAPLARPHARRLREIYRSAGWPCLDAIELDLLGAGLLQREPVRAPDGSLHDTLRVTDAGLAALAASLQRNRAAFDAHEQLVALVAAQMQRAGRVVYTGLSLRARVLAADAGETGQAAETPLAASPDLAEALGAVLPGTAGMPRPRWVMARPDVFSIRNTSVAGYLAPAVHEIKARRADLLGELRDTPRTRAKRAAYLDMSSECWYVLGRDAKDRPIGAADEIPAAFGVLQAERTPGGGWQLTVERPAPRRAMPHVAGLPFAAWLALARAVPLVAADDEAQGHL